MTRASTLSGRAARARRNSWAASSVAAGLGGHPAAHQRHALPHPQVRDAVQQRIGGLQPHLPGPRQVLLGLRPVAQPAVGHGQRIVEPVRLGHRGQRGFEVLHGGAEVAPGQRRLPQEGVRRGGRGEGPGALRSAASASSSRPWRSRISPRWTQPAASVGRQLQGAGEGGRGFVEPAGGLVGGAQEIGPAGIAGVQPRRRRGSSPPPASLKP